jgi:hypothetical protein
MKSNSVAGAQIVYLSNNFIAVIDNPLDRHLKFGMMVDYQCTCTFCMNCPWIA